VKVTASPSRVLGFSGVRNWSRSRRRREGDVIRWDNLEALRFLRWSKQRNRGKLHWRERGNQEPQGDGGKEAQGRRREEVAERREKENIGVGWRVRGTRRQ